MIGNTPFNPTFKEHLETAMIQHTNQVAGNVPAPLMAQIANNMFSDSIGVMSPATIKSSQMQAKDIAS
jgi:hypothetical protein